MQKKKIKVSNTGDGHYNTGEKYKKSKLILMVIHLSEYPSNTFADIIQDGY